MKRPIALAGLALIALMTAGCGDHTVRAPEAAVTDVWVVPPVVDRVTIDKGSLVAEGRAGRMGRVVIRAPGGAAHAVGADEEGRFVLRLPHPKRDTVFVVEAQSGQMGFPAPFRLFVAGEPTGPMALLSAGSATRRLDPAPALDAVDDDGQVRLISGRATRGAAVTVSAGGPTTATAGEDGRWVIPGPPAGPIVVRGSTFQPMKGDGPAGVLVRAGTGWSLNWTGPDGAVQHTWFPDRASTLR